MKWVLHFLSETEVFFLLELCRDGQSVELHTVTMLYGNMASIYAIRTKAINTFSHTVQYGHQWPYICGSATKEENMFLRSVNALEDKIE